MQAKGKPNIILIMTDQQTASAMSCMGNTDLHTPAMDRLAAAGVLFTNAYCTAPLSGPSRAAMFTGLTPESIGLDKNKVPLPDSLHNVTLGSLVSQEGYECAYAGKWHVHTPSMPDGEFGFTTLHPHEDRGLAEACVRYLEQPHKRPFFLVASFDNPHNICEYAREQDLPYGNLPELPADEWPGLPANFAQSPFDADVISWERSMNYNIYPTRNYTPQQWRRYRSAYFRLVEKVDAEIGKIVDAIEQEGLMENSVIIFTSDHGDGAGAHQWNQKSALYEEVVNVPLIVVLPGKEKAGARLPQLVSNGVDLFATICRWTGARMPQGRTGVSFKEIAEAGHAAQAHQEHIVIETLFNAGITRGWAVRTAQYKYVVYDRGSYREQLFDMERDRGETRNLALESRYAEVLQQHRRLLQQWQQTHRQSAGSKKWR